MAFDSLAPIADSRAHSKGFFPSLPAGPGGWGPGGAEKSEILLPSSEPSLDLAGGIQVSSRPTRRAGKPGQAQGTAWVNACLACFLGHKTISSCAGSMGPGLEN